jgi:hypothetical protein
MKIRIALFLLMVFTLGFGVVSAQEDDAGDDSSILIVLASSAITFEEDSLVFSNVASVVPTIYTRDDGVSFASLITEAFDASFGYEEELIAYGVLETETFQLEVLVRTVPGYDADSNPAVTFEIIEFVSGTEYVEDGDEYIEVEIDKLDDFYGDHEGVLYIVGDADFIALFIAGVDAYFEDARQGTANPTCKNPRAC